MRNKTIALLHPGEMGAAIGAGLVPRGRGNKQTKKQGARVRQSEATRPTRIVRPQFQYSCSMASSVSACRSRSASVREIAMISVKASFLWVSASWLNCSRERTYISVSV